VPEENIERAAGRACVDAGRSQRMELESLAGSDLGDCQGLKGLGKKTHHPSGTTSNNIQ
jgi:hypothetical protein